MIKIIKNYNNNKNNKVINKYNIIVINKINIIMINNNKI